MTLIPSHDILENLCKLRMRESEKLKTVLELYNMEIHQKKAEPDYHRLQTIVKRSIEQILRMKNFDTRNGNFEISAVVKNQRVKQREHRCLGDCWQWKANGQCSNAFSDTIRISVQNRHSRILLQGLLRSREWKMYREPRVLEAEAQVAAVQGLPQRNLHNSILWIMASSGVLVLQVREWLQIWG